MSVDGLHCSLQVPRIGSETDALVHFWPSNLAIRSRRPSSMAIEGFLALIRGQVDQVMGKQPRVDRRSGTSKSPRQGSSLLQLSTELVKGICLELDMGSICALQRVCKQLRVETSSGALWCALCGRKQIRLEEEASDEAVDWKHVFACFAPLRVRRLSSWEFASSTQLLQVRTTLVQ